MKENSIEEDIARIAKLITTKFNNDYSIDNQDKEAIEHILSAYKKILKENEELKNQEETARKVNELLVERYSTSIPVQKVKDKIRKNEEIIDISNDGDLIHELLQKNKVYEELLESEEEKKALKVINARTRRLLDELEIEKEDMSDEPRIFYLMQEIRANKTILNLIEKLQKENETKEKIIDDMADWLYKDDTSFGYGKLKEVNTKERIVKFFENKTEQKQ